LNIIPLPSFRIPRQQICCHNFLLCFAGKHPTVCVTGAGAGMDSVWEQRKLEARKILENAAESPASSARFVSPLLILQ
jgi:hypothetical protein